jgi:hypothetical protein
MGPERRQSVRKKVRLDVAVKIDRPEVFDGKIRDMNLDGAFVEFAGTVPRIGERLEAMLYLPHRRQLHRICFPATVLRTESDGAALKFEAYDLPTYKLLVRTLYSQ